AAVWPERCACTGWKRNAHAFQHRYGIRSSNELTIVEQSLASTGSALQLVCLACAAGASASSGSSLETHCLLLNNIRRHGWRFSYSCSCASPLSATTTSDVTSNVVTHIERTAEKFRRHVIPLCDQIIALFGERNNSHGIRFDFDLQACLIGDVPQRFT